MKYQRLNANTLYVSAILFFYIGSHYRASLIHTRLKSSMLNFKRVRIQTGVSPQHPNFNRVQTGSRTMEACKQQNHMVACKQQNHGSMEAAELWKQQNHGSMQAAELWKHHNHGSMQAAELKHASSRTMIACKQQNDGL